MDIKVNGKPFECAPGTTYLSLAKNFKDEYDAPIVLAVENHKYRELFRPVKADAEISFETVRDPAGNKSYKRSACMLMLKAFYDTVDASLIERVKLEFSISGSYYFTYKGNFTLDEKLLKDIKNRMDELVRADIPFQKTQMPLSTALERFDEHGMSEKKKLFKYRRYSTVNVYNLNKYEDYYYGHMVPSTAYITAFDLQLYDEGFMLVLPDRGGSFEKVGTFVPSPKLFATMKEATAWGEMLDVSCVADLNDCIANGGFPELMLVQEAL
ncbi:MAG: nucleoside kinase, partial [Lachnospiraceae bacterium]|nr:nucleoside kinase [Lachnospiraceae bacterium]